ncbi:hypothetical protein OsJ_26503 [Oryza sativa Japonica Group]|uniref:Uncharacterized protein n=1 Tax=Oryza sativa subsp. japonica TaxID=39947 RepID=A3BQW9_ORYSJ|nr:hypothetical protein OsJ_26503 [Oryza sativa Japonica Group]BAD01263.1 hypothetical protein [Oryza sativa Japonica Group]BAD03789.1 hypothetical protein [Oryza sativa Japonica Group]
MAWLTGGGDLLSARSGRRGGSGGGGALPYARSGGGAASLVPVGKTGIEGGFSTGTEYLFCSSERWFIWVIEGGFRYVTYLFIVQVTVITS